MLGTVDEAAVGPVVLGTAGIVEDPVTEEILVLSVVLKLEVTVPVVSELVVDPDTHTYEVEMSLSWPVRMEEKTRPCVQMKEDETGVVDETVTLSVRVVLPVKIVLLVRSVKVV